MKVAILACSKGAEAEPAQYKDSTATPLYENALLKFTEIKEHLEMAQGLQPKTGESLEPLTVPGPAF